MAIAQEVLEPRKRLQNHVELIRRLIGLGTDRLFQTICSFFGFPPGYSAAPQFMCVAASASV